MIYSIFYVKYIKILYFIKFIKGTFSPEGHNRSRNCECCFGFYNNFLVCIGKSAFSMVTYYNFYLYIIILLL